MRTDRHVAVMSALILITIALVAPAASAAAFEDVTVVVEEVSDNRFTKGPYVGGLELALNLSGELEGIDSARAFVTKAIDDKGNDLVLKDHDAPDFTSRNTNMGQLKVSLENPARGAKSVDVSGTAELFVPSQDPGAVVSLPGALAKLDTTLESPTFDREKMMIEILSPESQRKAESEELNEDDIKELRKRGKEAGASDEEIEEAIEFAKAMKEMAGETSDNSVILSGKTADIDRILKVRLLRPDGSEVSTVSRSWSSSGDDTVMIVELEEAPPADATLELTVLTKKATVSVPFSLSGIELP